MKIRRRFSIGNKLILMFGLLITVSSIAAGILAIGIARKAVIEKLESHLIDKVLDEAEIIDAKIAVFFQFLEDITRIPIIYDHNVLHEEKVKFLRQSITLKDTILELNISDTTGVCYADSGTIDVKNK